MPPRVDLNLFVVLDAIYSEGGITRASQTLNLTQPAVSHALGRLRDLLGDPLFVREGYAMAPTPLCHQLIGPVRNALREIKGAIHQLDSFDPATSQKQFRIGVRHAIETGIFPQLAARICAQAPGTSLAAVLHQRDSLHGELASGALDAAVDILLPRPQNIAHRALAGGRLVVAARAGHPEVKGGIDLETYLRLDHVLATSRRSGRGLEDMALQRLGYSRRIRVRFQQYWSACQFIAMTDMILTMPEHYARGVNAPLNNQIVPFPLDLPGQDLFLYWHTTREQDPANRWLRGQILQAFETGDTPVAGEDAR